MTPTLLPAASGPMAVTVHVAVVWVWADMVSAEKPSVVYLSRWHQSYAFQPYSGLGRPTVPAISAPSRARESLRAPSGCRVGGHLGVVLGPGVLAPVAPRTTSGSRRRAAKHVPA